MANKQLATPTPKAYSYIRFSTPEQAFGSSEARQLEAAQRYAEGNGLCLDASTIKDYGKSAFRGANRKTGALASFLELVRAGRIASGSVLIVENVDRLSREPLVKAFGLITEILGAGVTIQTLDPVETYNEAAINGGAAYALVGQIQMANAESVKKSVRLKDARERERRRAATGGRHPNTKNIPEWLTYENETFKVKPNAKATINQIFRWKSSGIGARTMVTRLNEGGDRYWVSSKSNVWRHSYIKKLLANRQLIGECQFYKMSVAEDGRKQRLPEGPPIVGYFPVVVTPEKFAAVQELLRKNRGSGGQTGNFHNVLRSLVRCAYCSGPMNYDDKGRGGTKGGPYLACANGQRRSGCERHRIVYRELVRLLLSSCPKLEPDQILAPEDEQAGMVQELQQSIAEKKALISENDKRIENYVDQIGRTSRPSTRDRYERLLQELEDSSKDAEQEMQKLASQLASAETQQSTFESWKQGLLKVEAEIYQPASVDLRMRLNLHLRQLIDRVEVFRLGYPTLATDEYNAEQRKAVRARTAKALNAKKGDAVADKIPAEPPAMDDIELYLESLADAAGIKVTSRVRKFFDEVCQRRLSAEGRFYRVFFKTGRYVDLAPETSLADFYRPVTTRGKQTLVFTRSAQHGIIRDMFEQFAKTK